MQTDSEQNMDKDDSSYSKVGYSKRRKVKGLLDKVTKKKIYSVRVKPKIYISLKYGQAVVNLDLLLSAAFVFRPGSCHTNHTDR